MAYFDNASTTYPKPYCVYDFMDSFYRSSGANAGRGNYKLAQSAGALIGDTRKKIQELLHCQAKQVVFEPTATIALNIIIQGIIEKGAVNIYISPFEHNAVTRTLHHFEEQEKIKITQLTVSKGMVYDLEKIRYQFDTVKPDFVIVSHASNVFGLIAPVEDIFALAKKYEAITLVDMAQTAGLVDLNVGLIDVFCDWREAEADRVKLKENAFYSMFNAKFSSADEVYESIYKQAKSSIYVVDNYIGLRTLVHLKNSPAGVNITLFSDNVGNNKLHNIEFTDFCKEYPSVKISMKKTGGIFHDRFIVLDYGTADERVFLCGASSKDAGARITSIVEDYGVSKYTPVIATLLKNPTLILPQ